MTDRVIKLVKMPDPPKEYTSMAGYLYDRKFITYHDDRYGSIAMLVFPRNLIHDEIRKKFRARGVISAGFIGIDRVTWNVLAYGCSESINASLKATEDDTKALQEFVTNWNKEHRKDG